MNQQKSKNPNLTLNLNQDFVFTSNPSLTSNSTSNLKTGLNIVLNTKPNTTKKHNYKNLSFFSFIFCRPLFVFVMFFTFICSFIFSTIFSVKKTNASIYTNYTYAQIKSDDTYLYKTPSNATVQNAYFALPNTYFVMLLSNYNDYLYKVQYRDIVGYVLKQKVYPIKEKPKTPYLQNITFRVYSSDGTKVYYSPFNTQEQNSFYFVEVFQTINYYGYILGDELIENRGLSWYYGKTNFENQTSNQNANQNAITGYFYSGLCDSLSSIPQNTESVTYISQVFLDEDNSFLFSLIDLSPALKILLVVLISLPSIGLIYLLFAPFKIRKEKLKNKTKNSCYKNKIKNKTKNKNTKVGFLARLKIKQNKNTKQKQLKNTKPSYNKNVLQNYKARRGAKTRNKNATINKIQKIIDDDIL